MTDESTLHICGPTHCSRGVMECRTCRCKRRVVFYHQAYYECLRRCTGCGEDPLGRPARFKRVSTERLRRINRAKEDWKAAMTFRDAVRLELEL